jgi:TonB family protein
VTFLFICAAKASILFLAAWIATLLLGRQPSALRHRIWSLAAAGALAIPLFSVTLPHWHPPAPKLVTLPSIASTVVTVTPATVPHRDLPDALPILWAAGCTAMLFRFLLGVLFIAYRSRPLFEETWMHSVLDLSARFAVRRPVRLLIARHAHAMPVTWGFWSPKILLPQAALEWTADRRDIVLSHELAHVGRSDWFWQSLSEIALCLYWFHPLAWLLASRLRRESERACDDAVLNSGIRASDYASELLHLSRTLKTSGQAWSTALAMARSSNLERRFITMLNPHANRNRVSATARILTSLAALSIVLPLATFRAPAQEKAGRVAGVVYDPLGAVVPHASVTMNNPQASTEDTVRADEAGRFSFVGLPAGSYELRVKAPGFQLYSRPQTPLAGGRDLSVAVTLALGQVNENINVTAAGKKTAARTSEAPVRIRVGGNVQATQLVRQVKPAYPESARAAGIEGTVVLQATIGTDGALKSVRVLNAQIDPDLAQAALSAVQQWLYKPSLLNGEPAEITTTITMNFTLSQQ